MKRLLLFALCAFTFTFAACEPADDQTPNGKLTLTSKAVMNFDKLGGTGEITFDFVADQTRKASPVTPSCSANWITDIELGTNNNVTFVVAPNEGDERSAQITLRAGQDNIHVMIMQEGAALADVNFKATHLGGTYFGKFITERGQTEGFNYFIILSDQQPSGIKTIPYGATQYRFDIYAEAGAEFSHKEVRIPVGTYTFDQQGLGRKGTIDGNPDASLLYDPNMSQYSFRSATLVVTETGINAEVILINGDVHRITYTGEPLLEDYSEDTYADVCPVSQYTDTLSFDVTGGYMYAYYRGDWFGTGHDVWFMHMIEDKSTFSGAYLIFNFITPKSTGGFNNPEGYLGEYTLSDPTKSLDWTFPAGRLRDDSTQLNAYYMYCEGGQIDMSKAAPIIDGSIKVEKVGNDTVITIDGKDDAGNDVKGTFSGVVHELDNQSVIAK